MANEPVPALDKVTTFTLFCCVRVRIRVRRIRLFHLPDETLNWHVYYIFYLNLRLAINCHKWPIMQ